MQQTAETQQTFATDTPIVAALAAPATENKTARNQICFSKGQPLIQSSSMSNSAYRVVHGEVLIVRHGRPVDLVEAGELLEADLWPDAMAIALTPGILEIMESPDPRVQTLLTAMKIS